MSQISRHAIIIKAHNTNNGITTRKSKIKTAYGSGWVGKQELTKQLYANKALRIARTNYAIRL